MAAKGSGDWVSAASSSGLGSPGWIPTFWRWHKPSDWRSKTEGESSPLFQTKSAKLRRKMCSDRHWMCIGTWPVRSLMLWLVSLMLSVSSLHSVSSFVSLNSTRNCTKHQLHLHVLLGLDTLQGTAEATEIGFLQFKDPCHRVLSLPLVSLVFFLCFTSLHKLLN